MSAFLALALAANLAVPDGFTFAAGGDMIGPYRVLPAKPDPGFAQAVVLFKSADLGFANQEGSIFDLKTFPGTPAAENGGGYPLQPSSFARDLKSIGIGMVSKANNHATDWGTEGFRPRWDGWRWPASRRAARGRDWKPRARRFIATR